MSRLYRKCSLGVELSVMHDARTNSTDNETLDVESDNKRNHSMIKMHIPLSYLRELPQRKV